MARYGRHEAIGALVQVSNTQHSSIGRIIGYTPTQVKIETFPHDLQDVDAERIIDHALFNEREIAQWDDENWRRYATVRRHGKGAGPFVVRRYGVEAQGFSMQMVLDPVEAEGVFERIKVAYGIFCHHAAEAERKAAEAHVEHSTWSTARSQTLLLMRGLSNLSEVYAQYLFEDGWDKKVEAAKTDSYLHSTTYWMAGLKDVLTEDQVIAAWSASIEAVVARWTEIITEQGLTEADVVKATEQDEYPKSRALNHANYGSLIRDCKTCTRDSEKAAK